MAGLGSSTISNAQFRPFSYQEMLAPLSAYTQEYNTIQNGLSDLGTVADSYKQYIPDNSQAGQQLKAYNDQLDSLATDMAQHGLSAGSNNRDSLMNLKRTYNNRILGINQAAQSLQRLYKLAQQKQAQDNSLMVGHMPTIDEIIANPAAAPQMVSGNELYAHGTKAAQAASLRNFSHSEMGKALQDQYFNIVDKTGYNSKDAQDFLKNAESIPELKEALDNVTNMYAVNGLNTNDASRAKLFALQGILDGMSYQEKHDYEPNKQWDLDAELTKMDRQHQYNEEEEADKMELDLKEKRALAGDAAKQQAAQDATNGTPYVDPESVMESSGEYNKLLDATSGLFNSQKQPLAHYFGKKGNVNPMRVYEEAQQEAKRATNNVAAYPGFPGMGGAKAAVQSTRAGIERILKKYGVNDMITPAQYNALRDLGYTSKSNFLGEGFKYSKYASGIFSAIKDRLNNKNTTNTVYWIPNNKGIQDFGDDIINNIKAYAKTKSDLKGRLVKADGNLNKTNKNGSASDFDPKDNPIVKIGTSARYKNNLILQTKDGQRYIAAGSLADDIVKGSLDNWTSKEIKLKVAARRKKGAPLNPAENAAIQKMAALMTTGEIVKHKFMGKDQVLSPTTGKDKDEGSSTYDGTYEGEE